MQDDKLKFIRFGFLIVWLLVLFAPMVSHFFGFFDSDYIIMTERRKPAKKPRLPGKFSAIGQYFTDMESYLNDHFGFRSWLVTANNILKLKFGVSGSKLVLMGKKNWMYYTRLDAINQYRGINRFSTREIKNFLKIFKNRETYLKRSGIPFIIFAAPIKPSIYPEFLPLWAKKVAPSRMDQLINENRDYGLEVIDPRPELTDLSVTDKSLYFQTDMHWNYKGAFIGYRILMKEIKKHFHRVKVLKESDIIFTNKKRKGLGLAKLMNIVAFTKEDNFYSIKFSFPSNIKNIREIKNNKYVKANQSDIQVYPYYVYVVKTRLKNTPRVLMVRDSYSNAMVPFLNQTFREIIYVHHENMKFDYSLIEKFKPDLVVYQFLERHLVNQPIDINSIHDRYTQDIQKISVPDTMVENEKSKIELTVKNCSGWEWKDKGNAWVRLGYRWYKHIGAGTKSKEIFSSRIPIKNGLKPGKTAVIRANIKVPGNPGKYKLRFSMVHERKTWFEDMGAKPLDVWVDIIKK